MAHEVERLFNEIDSGPRGWRARSDRFQDMAERTVGQPDGEEPRGAAPDDGGAGTHCVDPDRVAVTTKAPAAAAPASWPRCSALSRGRCAVIMCATGRCGVDRAAGVV